MTSNVLSTGLVAASLTSDPLMMSKMLQELQFTTWSPPSINGQEREAFLDMLSKSHWLCIEQHLCQCVLQVIYWSAFHFDVMEWLRGICGSNSCYFRRREYSCLCDISVYNCLHSWSITWQCPVSPKSSLQLVNPEQMLWNDLQFTRKQMPCSPCRVNNQWFAFSIELTRALDQT